jgi:hypothetical protein
MRTIIRSIWNVLGPRSERGSVMWWGFQTVAMLTMVAVLMSDGKWWAVFLLPVSGLTGYHTVRASQRHEFF